MRDPIVFKVLWFERLDVYLSWRWDQLSWLFSILIAVFACGVALFLKTHLHDSPKRLQFWPAFLLLFISMLGLVGTDNFVMLCVFWQLTSLSSYWWMTFSLAREPARATGLQTLLVTGLGALAILSAAILLAFACESFEISRAIELKNVLRDHKVFEPVLLLFLLAAFTNLARFSFLAPTSISALLNSAILVMASIYLLLRLHPIFQDTFLWDAGLLIIGSIVFVWAAVRSLLRNHFKNLSLLHFALKTILAYGRWQTRSLQDGRLRHYVLITAITAIWAVMLGLSRSNMQLFDEMPSLGSLSLLIGTFVLIFTGLIFLLEARSNVFAVKSLGIVGWAMSLLFLITGAPNVAITQFMGATLSTWLIVTVIQKTPKPKKMSSKITRFRDGVIASLFGAMMMFLTGQGMREQIPSRLTSIFLFSVAVGAFFSAAIYLLLRRSWIKVIWGLVLLSHACVLFIFAFDRGEDLLSQTLITVAIVIGFCAQAMALFLFRKVALKTNSNDMDHLEEMEC